MVVLTARVALPDVRSMRRTHVAIVDPRYIEPILTGAKRAEIRLTCTRRVPFGRIDAGDRVLFRARSGWYFARAGVQAVDGIELASRGDFDHLRRRCGEAVGAPDAFWIDRSHARFATVVWLGRVQTTRIGPDPRDLAAPGCRSAWFVTDVPRDRWIHESDRTRAQAVRRAQ